MQIFKRSSQINSGFLLGIFFRGVDRFTNFFCYAIVFGPNFREGQKFSGEKTASGGCLPLPPCGKKPELNY